MTSRFWLFNYESGGQEFESLDDDHYKKIRGEAASFMRADRNLRALVDLRNRIGAPTAPTTLTLQMIQMHHNSDEAARFLGYCAELEVDRGVVRWSA